MADINEVLGRRLGEIREQGLYRHLRRVESAQGRLIEIGGRALLNVSSNDYLGLANEPELKEAAMAAISRYGAGAGASRLISGSLAPHHELEETIAAFKQTEAAISFSSGYATALGAICALLDKDSIVVLDKLVHACIVDAARLSGARMRVYAHNDMGDLEEILKWADRTARESAGRRVLVVTESVFSMDGDHAPLCELVELKERYGAWLMLDEAHATGLYGPNRRGLAEAAGVAGRIEIQMGTLGKALGAAGGYVAGSRVLVDYLVNRARSFIFSTAPVPAAAAAAAAGIRYVQSSRGRDRCQHLWSLVSRVRLPHGEQPPPHSAIVPVMVGDESDAMTMASQLRESGLFIPAVRYPTVARGAARLRLTLTAAHTPEDIARVNTALADALASACPGAASRLRAKPCD